MLSVSYLHVICKTNSDESFDFVRQCRFEPRISLQWLHHGFNYQLLHIGDQFCFNSMNQQIVNQLLIYNQIKFYVESILKRGNVKEHTCYEIKKNMIYPLTHETYFEMLMQIFYSCIFQFLFQTYKQFTVFQFFKILFTKST